MKLDDTEIFILKGYDPNLLTGKPGQVQTTEFYTVKISLQGLEHISYHRHAIAKNYLS